MDEQDDWATGVMRFRLATDNGFQLAPGEYFIQCPYDECHITSNFKCLQHFTKCRKRYLASLPNVRDSKIHICQYDAAHHLHEKDYEEHLARCPKRYDPPSTGTTSGYGRGYGTGSTTTLFVEDTSFGLGLTPAARDDDSPEGSPPRPVESLPNATAAPIMNKSTTPKLYTASVPNTGTGGGWTEQPTTTTTEESAEDTETETAGTYDSEGSAQRPIQSRGLRDFFSGVLKYNRRRYRTRTNDEITEESATEIETGTETGTETETE